MARTPPPPRDLGKNSRKPGGYFPRDAAVVSTAARHQRNITRAELLALGLDDEGIRRRVRNGRLFRAHHGVYSVGSPPMTPLERASAAVLACGPGAALSHASAMTLWGFWSRWDELDSWEFHKDPIAFQSDRERDAETLSHGFVTLRITWERIKRAAAREGARLRMILARRRGLLGVS